MSSATLRPDQVFRCATNLIWKTLNPAPVSGENAERLIRLLELLELHDDLDDVQNVHANCELSDAEMARLAG